MKMSIPKTNVSGQIQQAVFEMLSHQDDKTALDRIGWPYLFHMLIKCSALYWDYMASFQAHETWVPNFTRTLCYNGVIRQNAKQILAFV